MSTMIPDEVATMAGGPEPIGPPGEPPLGGGGGMPPELAGLMGGGGAPPPDAGGGLPPELAGLMGGGPEEAPPEEAGGGSEIDQLTTILDGIMQYMQIASDDIEKSKMMGAAKIVQDLLAKNQQEAEAAGGIGPAQKGMAKAIAG